VALVRRADPVLPGREAATVMRVPAAPADSVVCLEQPVDTAPVVAAAEVVVARCLTVPVAVVAEAAAPRAAREAGAERQAAAR
jgi:hypothetical protein